ncbi:hypothetical protein PACTADRAFT_14325 [Pachysolen tannophilus NRRL Y-2460]|uniref:chitin synthase n=1 Tax=Pachysolen tannophilus NRRL Y-2460 TaxID=669874 RepID=A0A1E4U1D9_PACTA|nr:hypothetical protein PACTADRAFT_14325 [Pachysolen tannophilus NRRL Y-2460]
MSDPFKDQNSNGEKHNPFRNEFEASGISRPSSIYSNSTSPRRYANELYNESNSDQVHGFPTQNQYSPNKKTAKYSPAVFSRSREGRNNDDIYGSSVGNSFIGRARKDSDDGTSVSERYRYTNIHESPKKNKPTFINMDDDVIDTSDITSHYNGKSPSRFVRNTSANSRSTKSSDRVLAPPKPIFSAQTFAAANASGNFSNHPDINSEARTNSHYSEKSSISFNANQFRINDTDDDDNTTVYSSESLGGDKLSNSLSYSDYEDSESFKQSLDGNMFAELPADYQPRRNNHTATQKQFYLQNGNLILDNAVPSKLLNFLPLKDEREFNYMRYSAVTSDADDFSASGFSLRAADLKRETEIVICVTMYNEDAEAFTRTMHAIMKNIVYLTKRKKSPIWGDDSWEKIVVVIVSDGRGKCSESVLEVLSAMGVYQSGIAKSFVNNKEVNAHLFEYTTQISIDEDLKFMGSEKGIVPVQICFCLKEKNAKKINSHRWLFNAFCPVLQPNVCVLLDVGTQPDSHAIYNLWKAFDQDSNVAGTAGEIKTINGKYWKNLMNPLVASQNFEYKMSNILDKPLESVFGYISVLPGALSAYRYTALENHEDGTGPLNSYFKGENLDTAENHDIFTANMYLAEDRILCWELVAKRNAKWVLKYVRSATGSTDVPEKLSEFISQRRRWLNGAFFAALYSQVHFRQIWATDHSFIRKFFLHIEFIYQFVQLLFSFFSLGNFYLTFYYLAGALINVIPNNGGYWIFQILNYLCVSDLVGMFMISMGNRPQGAKKLYLTSLLILVFCGLYAYVAGIYFTISAIKTETIDPSSDTSNSFSVIIVSLLSTYGLYAFMSLAYMDFFHIFTSSLQYFLLLPAYTCLLQIYAFCNTHDVSWGTKGDNAPETNLGNAVVKKDKSGKEIVEVEIIGDQMDIDNVYDEVLFNLRSRRQTPLELRTNSDSNGPSHEDYYRDVRTRVVLVWLVANLILIMTITQVYDADAINTNKYLEVILICVAALAGFRAIGSFAYLGLLGLRNIDKQQTNKKQTNKPYLNTDIKENAKEKIDKNNQNKNIDYGLCILFGEITLFELTITLDVSSVKLL